MATFLLTWNPDKWNGEITSPMAWSCGNTKKIIAGDRLFLIRQGREPRGICASGWATSDVMEDETRQEFSSRYVRMQIEVYRDPTSEAILSRQALHELNVGVENPMNWGVQISGTEIPSPTAVRLEHAWRQLCGGKPSYPDELVEADRLIEGSRRLVSVNAYERNPIARNRCVKHHGTNCCICGFNFGAIYGEEAEGHIHVHHLRPLFEIGGEYIVDPVEDLRPVCPNCHAVVHLGGRCRTTDEVKRLLERNKPA